MAEDNNPSDPVVEVLGTDTAKGKENAGTPPAGMSLEDINTLTGRTYATLEEAQKGVKETYAFVGGKPKVVEVIKEKVVIPDNVVSREEFETANFFRDNPEANKHRQLIEQVAKAQGITVQAAVETEFVKNTISKLNVADEAASARSGLTSSPRLGIIRDASTKAVEAFSNSQKARAGGDTLTADRLQREAETEALSAVISAYDLGGKSIS